MDSTLSESGIMSPSFSCTNLRFVSCFYSVISAFFFSWDEWFRNSICFRSSRMRTPMYMLLLKSPKSPRVSLSILSASRINAAPSGPMGFVPISILNRV